jgi:hypothetical protein
MEIPRGHGATTQYAWPEDCMIQGGTHGTVFSRTRPTYTTAFFEAFPRNPDTFLRGEGETVTDAEHDAWQKWQRILNCPSPTGHEYETRGYRNGSGFCKHCNLFMGNVFDLASIGSVCTVCGVGTYWTVRDDKIYCETHAPPRADDDPLKWLDE